MPLRRCGALLPHFIVRKRLTRQPEAPRPPACIQRRTLRGQTCGRMNPKVCESSLPQRYLRQRNASNNRKDRVVSVDNARFDNGTKSYRVGFSLGGATEYLAARLEMTTSTETEGVERWATRNQTTGAFTIG